MGTSSWSPDDWAGYSASTAHKPTAKVFTSSSMDDSLDPKNAGVRESRDSEAHPSSTAIYVGLDVTGSMFSVIDSMAKKGLGVLVEEILDRKPVTDPHIMISGIGDIEYDNSPLQVTQFETDITITDQIEKIWLEGGGGANMHESYDLPWYMAAFRTSIDCYEKRGKKGYLFTVGDEETPQGLTADQIVRVFGGQPERDLTPEELLDAASRMYNVFHVVVEEGHHARHYHERVMDSWQELLGQRVLPLSDHTQLAEVIVSTIAINEGADHKTVADSWSGDTSLVVANATKGLIAADGTSTGVTRL